LSPALLGSDTNRANLYAPDACENGGEKLGHGSGGMELLRAA